MSSDEWVARGLDFAWKAHDFSSSGSLSSAVHKQHLLWIDRAIRCFEKAGAVGDKCASKARVHKQVLAMRQVLYNTSCEPSKKDDHGTSALDETKFDFETERNAAKIVAKCIEEGMWLESAALGNLLCNQMTMCRSEQYGRLFSTHVSSCLAL